MLGRRRLAPLAAIVLLAPGLAGVQALNPTDEDAGQSGDAGDHRHLARSVEPGLIEGRLTTGLDAEDWYVFDAEQGDELSLNVSDANGLLSVEVHGPEGEVQFFQTAGGASSWLLPSGGPWALHVHLVDEGVRNAASAEPGVPYRVQLGLEDPGPVEIHDLDGAGQSLEVNLTERGELTFTAQVSASTDAFDPATAGSLLRTAPADPDLLGYGSFLHIETDGAGRSIAVKEEPVPNVNTRLERTDTPTGTELRITSSGEFPHMLGALRLVHYGLGPDVTGFVAVATDGTTAHTQDASPVSWGEPAASTGKILLPGASQVGARDRALTVDRPFYGLFELDEGEGWAQDPSGHRTAVDPGHPLALLDPQRGEWLFHVNETTGAGLEAEHRDLDGVFVPRLGLMPANPPSAITVVFLLEDGTPLVPG